MTAPLASASWWWVAVALGTVVTVACKTDDSSSVDGACDRYFNALLRPTCNTSAPTAERVAQIGVRFKAYCTKQMQAPGITSAAAALDRCSTYFETAGCALDRDALDAACGFAPGALGDGARCVIDAQCQSSECKKTVPVSPTDSVLVTSNECGVCQATLAEGSTCSPNDACAKGLECRAGTCRSAARLDIGGDCSGGLTCKSHLRCDRSTRTCAARAKDGEPCAQNVDCQESLRCLQERCAPKAGDGADCLAFSDCAAPFSCHPQTRKCMRRPAVGAGQPCDTFSVCDRGNCNTPLNTNEAGIATGTCPTLIADGQPCNQGDRAALCDEFSTCQNGVCTPHDPSSCQ